jgi:hypothetical protein
VGKNQDPHLQNNQSKKSWWRGLSGQVHPYQVWSPEFNHQYHEKKKKKEGEEAAASEKPGEDGSQGKGERGNFSVPMHRLSDTKTEYMSESNAALGQ